MGLLDSIKSAANRQSESAVASAEAQSASSTDSEVKFVDLPVYLAQVGAYKTKVRVSRCDRDGVEHVDDNGVPCFHRSLAISWMRREGGHVVNGIEYIPCSRAYDGVDNSIKEPVVVIRANDDGGVDKVLLDGARFNRSQDGRFVDDAGLGFDVDSMMALV